MKRRDDSKQTLFGWAEPVPETAAVAPEAAAGAMGLPIPPDRGQEQPAADAAPLLVQPLPWDFSTTFPPPREDAIEAGVLQEEDREIECLRVLHQNYANHALTILRGLDAVADARRRGVDPATGKAPRSHAARERFREYLNKEPGRLSSAYDAMLGSYRDGFGDEAADALDKALRAWHAGVEVVIDGGDVKRPAPVQVEPAAAPPAAPLAAPRKARRVSSVMPVPRPLPSAVAAGRFGHEEDGRPTNPGPAEVRAITANHAEKLVDLIETLTAVEQPPRIGHAADEAAAKLKAALAAYAEDFGQDAADRLEAHARRRATEDRNNRSR